MWLNSDEDFRDYDTMIYEDPDQVDSEYDEEYDEESYMNDEEMDDFQEFMELEEADYEPDEVYEDSYMSGDLEDPEDSLY